MIKSWSNRIEVGPERSPINDPTNGNDIFCKRSPRVVLFNVLKIGLMTE